MSRLRQNLQSVERHALGALTQARTMAALRPGLDRWRQCAKRSPTLSDRQEHGLPLASPFPTTGSPASGHARKRDCRSRRNLFPGVFQGTAPLATACPPTGGAGRTRGTGADRIAVRVVRDRSGQTADFRLEKLDAPHVIAVLRPLIDPDAILCSDGANVYKTFAREAGITHRPINVQQRSRVLDGVFHLQNVMPTTAA